MGATPAETILSGQEHAEAEIAEPVPLSSLEPVPLPGSETELDQLRYELRAAILELNQEEGRLSALHDAAERNKNECWGEREGVTEAETLLREARQHSRAHLIAAYIDNRPTDEMSEADAQVQLAIRRDHLAHAEEIGEALRAEIASIENGLPQRQHDIARAAGRLVSRSPQFLAVVQRIYDSYAALRDCRLIISEIQRHAYLDDDLVRLADNNQPSTGYRFGGYLNNEHLIATWTNAITRLLGNADAPLPGANGSNGTAGSSDPSPSPVRGAPHRGSAPRRRARGAATPLSRAARQQRAGKTAGMPVRRRALLVRERDPATGKWLPQRKAADQQPAARGERES